MNFLYRINMRLTGPDHGWRSLFLALVCLACFAPGIAALPPTDRDESRFIQATSQMAETGDYLDIRFQETPRYKKPIGIYWMQSAALKMTRADPRADIWSYRLVSILGASIAVLAAAQIGARMFGGTAGLVSGLLMASVFMLCFEARIAKTDAILLACCIVAQGCLAAAYTQPERRQGRLNWLIFWTALGVGILVKGPVAPILSALTVCALFAIDRDIAWLKPLRPLPGLAIMLAVAAPWLIAITLKSGSAFWAEAIGKDLLGKVAEGQESHGAPPGYYTLIFSLFIWPLPVIAVQGGLAALSMFKQDRRLRFLLAWYIPWWLLVELMPTKLPHYVLPAYPALVLMSAWYLSKQAADHPAPRWHVWLINSTRLGLLVATLAIAALAIGLPLYFGGQFSAFAALAALIAIAAGVFALNLKGQLNHDPVRTAAVMATGSVAVWALMAGFILPGADALWPSRQIAAASRQELGNCTQPRLLSAGFHEPSLVVLAGTNTLLTDGGGAAAALLHDRFCSLVAVTESEKAAFLEALGSLAPSIRASAEIDAVNYSKGSKVEITLYRFAP